MCVFACAMCEVFSDSVYGSGAMAYAPIEAWVGFEGCNRPAARTPHSHPQTLNLNKEGPGAAGFCCTGAPERVPGRRKGGGGW